MYIEADSVRKKKEIKLGAWVRSNRPVFARRDLNFLLRTLFDKDSGYALFDEVLDFRALGYLEKLKELYIEGLPLAYILGKEEFFGLIFLLKRGVFIPRCDTEVVVERALELIHREEIYYVLDLCCGTGCISIAIDKTKEKRLKIFASDISQKALQSSSVNKRSHKSSVNFIQSNLLSAFKDRIFDLIVSNPPYIEENYFKDNHFLRYEPQEALRAGEDGLSFIKNIISDARLILKKNGFLVIEMGFAQKDSIERVLCDYEDWQVIEWFRDYSGNWRGVILKLG